MPTQRLLFVFILSTLLSSLAVANETGTANKDSALHDSAQYAPPCLTALKNGQLGQTKISQLELGDITVDETILSETEPLETSPIEAITLETETSLTECEEIRYLSGGISGDEVAFMKSIAHLFSLEMVFVQADKGKEVYLADVVVSLQNDKEEILRTLTDGPFLFVHVPNGKYTITASYKGIEQTRQVNITKGKHRRTVFLWREEVEPVTPMENQNIDVY